MVREDQLLIPRHATTIAEITEITQICVIFVASGRRSTVETNVRP